MLGSSTSQDYPYIQKGGIQIHFNIFRVLWVFTLLFSLEMPVPSQGHYGFHSFPVVDLFCLFI